MTIRKKNVWLIHRHAGCAPPSHWSFIKNSLWIYYGLGSTACTQSCMNPTYLCLVFWQHNRQMSVQPLTKYLFFTLNWSFEILAFFINIVIPANGKICTTNKSLSTFYYVMIMLFNYEGNTIKKLCIKNLGLFRFQSSYRYYFLIALRLLLKKSDSMVPLLHLRKIVISWYAVLLMSY